jgi:hypothetical protein
MTTAHRGSDCVRALRLRCAAQLIRRNNPLRDIWAELEAANGRAIFQPDFRHRAPASGDAMEARNPLLAAFRGTSIASPVPYHSIIANIRSSMTPDTISDGFVDYWSAHVDGAESERIVTSVHACEANAEVIAEVRRIVTAHVTHTATVTRPPRAGRPEP